MVQVERDGDYRISAQCGRADPGNGNRGSNAGGIIVRDKDLRTVGDRINSIGSGRCVRIAGELDAFTSTAACRRA